MLVPGPARAIDDNDNDDDDDDDEDDEDEDDDVQERGEERTRERVWLLWGKLVHFWL